jgi:hypothetical protein
MAGNVVQHSKDWLRSPRTTLPAWWAPQGAVIAGLFLLAPARAVVWIVALIWMGTACISQCAAMRAYALPLHGVRIISR